MSILIKAIKSDLKDPTFKNYIRGKLVSLCLRGQGIARFEHKLLEAFDDMESASDEYLERLYDFIEKAKKEYK